MAKDAYYFSHDYGARNDPKLQKVQMRLGHEGKSIFWDLIEMLYEEGGYLELAESESYAYALRTDIECITRLINEFDLFKKDEKRFWSESVLRRLQKRNEKSKKASVSAKKRWDNANAPNLDAIASENDAIKERKGKEIKEVGINKLIPIVGSEKLTPTASLNLPTDNKPKEQLTKIQMVRNFIASFNKIRAQVIEKESKYQATKKIEESFHARRLEYSSEDMRSAVKRAFADSLHIENNFKYLTPEYILRPTIMERYVNMLDTTKDQERVIKIVY